MKVNSTESKTEEDKAAFFFSSVTIHSGSAPSCGLQIQPGEAKREVKDWISKSFPWK
jgi:hypothetical protein